MIFPQSLLLVCVLTLIRSSVSKPTHHVTPSYVPIPDGQTPDPKPAAIPLNVSSTNTTGNQTSARQNSTSHRGAGDPCGPYSSYPNYQMKQTDFETTINTCGKINTTFTHAPSIYGVQCLNANPSWDQAINLTSCASNMDSKCSSIAEGFEPASQWSWSSGGPNCTMGSWINPLPAAQPSDLYESCMNDVYALMQSTCFTSQGKSFNVAAVNLQTLPGLGTNGSQVDSGYPSYIIVPETYNDDTA
ncbi:hypothetical protein BDR22DRAFT_884660 [Usnea florida]